ncbi:MAG: response regulator transcription factor [Bacteroidetes bacterium]|nr:MAG: response regulator transcription factor [Bacteroidota bacterium]
MKKIKILLADNSFLIRQGFKSVIKEIDNFSLVGEAEKAEDLSEKLLLAQPDVLIIDYASAFFCADDIYVIKENYPTVKILAVTNPASKAVMSMALENGATGHLLKSCAKEEIIEAINFTAGGQKYLCGKIVDILVRGQNDISDSSSCEGVKLSDREIEIIQLIAAGLGNKQIADKLFLSVHTVATHRKNIMSKIGVNNSAGLVMFAIRQNLITRGITAN